MKKALLFIIAVFSIFMFACSKESDEPLTKTTDTQMVTEAVETTEDTAEYEAQYNIARAAEEKGYYTVAYNLYQDILEYEDSKDRSDKIQSLLAEYNGTYYGKSAQEKNTYVYLYVDNGTVRGQFDGRDISPVVYEFYRYGKNSDGKEILAFAPAITETFAVLGSGEYGDGFAIQGLGDGSYFVGATEDADTFIYNGFYDKISDYSAIK